MDEILLHFDTMGNLVFLAQGNQGFTGGAGFRPSTVETELRGFARARTVHENMLCLHGFGCSSSVLVLVVCFPPPPVELLVVLLV